LNRCRCSSPTSELGPPAGPAPTRLAGGPGRWTHRRAPCLIEASGPRKVSAAGDRRGLAQELPARRRLEDFAREQRGTVKAHEVPTHGDVVELSKADGYGFIQASEQRIYFNRASVLDDAFDDLTVGASVAFVEEQGEKGPQASTVRVLGKHHYVAP